MGLTIGTFTNTYGQCDTHIHTHIVPSRETTCKCLKTDETNAFFLLFSVFI